MEEAFISRRKEEFNRDFHTVNWLSDLIALYVIKRVSLWMRSWTGDHLVPFPFHSCEFLTGLCTLWRSVMIGKRSDCT